MTRRVMYNNYLFPYSFRKRSKYLSYILPRAHRLRQQREQQLQRELQLMHREHDQQVTHTETQEELCSSSSECEVMSTPAQIHKRNSVQLLSRGAQSSGMRYYIKVAKKTCSCRYFTKPLKTNKAETKNEANRKFVNIYEVLICFFTRLRQLLVRELFWPLGDVAPLGSHSRANACLGPSLPGVPATHPGQCLTIVRHPVFICYRYLPVFTIGRIFFMLIFRTSRQRSIAELTESRPNRCILTQRLRGSTGLNERCLAPVLAIAFPTLSRRPESSFLTRCYVYPRSEVTRNISRDRTEIKMHSSFFSGNKSAFEYAMRTILHFFMTTYTLNCAHQISR